MLSRSELKRESKVFVSENLNVLLAITIVHFFIVALLSLIFQDFAGIIIMLVTGPLYLGTTYIYLQVIRKQEAVFNDLWSFFTVSEKFTASLVWFILTSIYIFLWSLLLVIPGVIKLYSYRMSKYILADNPKLSANQAITKSREMMHDKKLELFVLDLSFIGWMMLGAITFGIAFLWITPYMETTKALFYERLKSEHLTLESGDK